MGDIMSKTYDVNVFEQGGIGWPTQKNTYRVSADSAGEANEYVVFDLTKKSFRVAVNWTKVRPGKVAVNARITSQYH